MKRLALISMLLVASLLYAGDTRGADLDRLQSSGVILTQIMSAPDRAIPDAIMDGAKCLAIVPSMLNGGFIVGANYGKGVATCRTGKGWSAPVFFKIEGGSFGFQAGGQASDLVLIIRTEEGMRYLLASKFKLGGDASAAAGPVGRDAQASTDLTLRAQVLTYSRARGLFLGVSLNGAVIHQAEGDTMAFYRKDVPFRAILSGETPVPLEAEPFLKTVEKYAPTHHANSATTASATPAPSTATTAPTTTPAPVASSAAAPESAPSEGTPTTDTPPHAQPSSQPATEAAPVQTPPATSSTKPAGSETPPPPTGNQE
jgi:lipid-binding SYLF domain-containing protein